MAEPSLKFTKAREWLFLKKTTQDFLVRYFDGIFVFFTFAAIGVLLYFTEQKLAFLNFFFLPILLIGYFINTRAAVLGSLLTITWVMFFAVLQPEGFSGFLTQRHLFLHLSVWGAFLALTGAVVGKMNEELRRRFARASDTLGQLNELQQKLEETNKRLADKNMDLELTKSRVEAVLYSTMDPMVAKMIIDRKLQSEKRPVTVLFTDLAEFTSYAEERPPESVIEDLNRLFCSMEPVLLRYRGHLDKYLGDGFMAEFGLPYEAQNHALLAALSAMKMQERMAARDFPWKMRIGVASGTALVGLTGSEHRKNYTAIGDTVNLASRLQEVAPLGGICVDEQVWSQVKRWFHGRPIRAGLSAEDVKALEGRLHLLEGAIAQAPTAKLCLEAADLCSQIGDNARAAAFHKQAIDLDPAGMRFEVAVAAAMLTGEDRNSIAVKGKKRRVAAYELCGLKDPFDNVGRLPPHVAAAFREMSAKVHVPADELLPIEALEGTIGHARVTSGLAAALADAMGLDERQKRTVFLAAYVHDIGKRNVPERLLGCEHRLSELSLPDQGVIKAHPGEAARVMADLAIPTNPEIVEAVAQHHERFDGSGYPNHLRGTQVSLAARIIALSETYETLTSWRYCSEPVTPREALETMRGEIEAERFDPQVGKIFLKMMGV